MSTSRRRASAISGACSRTHSPTMSSIASGTGSCRARIGVVVGPDVEQTTRTHANTPRQRMFIFNLVGGIVPPAAGTSARRRFRRPRPAAGDSPACQCSPRIKYGAGYGVTPPPWPARRSRRWWSPGRWSAARRRVRHRRPKPGPAAPGSPGPAGGRGPTGSCAGRYREWRAL